MNTQKQTSISVPLEDLLQLLELSDRLVKLGFTSRIEASYLNNFSSSILQVFNDSKNPVDENNKVDENDKKE